MNKKNLIKELEELLQSKKVTPTASTKAIIEKLDTPMIQDGITLYNLLKRPEITLEKLENVGLINLQNYPEPVKQQVEIDIKYEGYITKATREAEKMIKLENKKIPENIDYSKIPNIASEARQKLEEVRPTSIGQAIRISGVNPADISILTVYLKKEYHNESKWI